MDNNIYCKDCGQSLESLKHLIELYGSVYPTFSKFLYNQDQLNTRSFHTLSHTKFNLQLLRPLHIFDNSTFSINLIDGHHSSYLVKLIISLLV